MHKELPCSNTRISASCAPELGWRLPSPSPEKPRRTVDLMTPGQTRPIRNESLPITGPARPLSATGSRPGPCDSKGDSHWDCAPATHQGDQLLNAPIFGFLPFQLTPPTCLPVFPRTASRINCLPQMPVSASVFRGPRRAMCPSESIFTNQTKNSSTCMT